MTKGIGRNERVIATLNDLAEAFKHKDYRAYGRLVKASKLSEEFTKRLTSKDDSWRKTKNSDHQEEVVRILSNVIENANEAIQKQESMCAEASEKLLKAEEALKKAEAEVKAARKYADEQMSKRKKLEREKKETNRLRVQEEKKLEQMKKITLVHHTATLSSLEKRKETTIVCTSFDAERMGFTRFVDYVCVCTDSNMVEDSVLHKAEEELDSFEEVLSAAEYVNMVVKYYVENKDYELLYNSETIKQMLESLEIDYKKSCKN